MNEEYAAWSEELLCPLPAETTDRDGTLWGRVAGRWYRLTSKPQGEWLRVQPAVNYKAVASEGIPDEWRVEGVDHDRGGIVYVTIFSGPDAELRAREYASFKNAAGSQP